MNNQKDWTRKKLLSLPERKWDEVKDYYSVIVVPTGKKHPDSGYALMAIVGCNGYTEPYEIAAYCDIIQFSGEPMDKLRCDMFDANRCVRFYSIIPNYMFRVGISISTVDIELIEKVIRKIE